MRWQFFCYCRERPGSACNPDLHRYRHPWNLLLHRCSRLSSILWQVLLLNLRPSSSFGKAAPAKLQAKQCLQGMLAVCRGRTLTGFIGLKHWGALADAPQPTCLGGSLRKWSPIFCINFQDFTNEQTESRVVAKTVSKGRGHGYLIGWNRILFTSHLHPV